MFYQMNVEKLKGYSYEMGPARPPSEGQARSLLIRATRNCPWNRCQFCAGLRSRKGKKFEYRKVEEIKEDIDIAKGIFDEIKTASWKLGYGGGVADKVVKAIIQGNPEIYGGDSADSEGLEQRLQCLIHVANWLDSGAKTVFLQDSNSLIMRTPELIEVLRHLKETFPSIERITTYARSKTTRKKSPEELKELHNAGLSRVHVGLESGYDEVLKFMEKGVTAEEHIQGGRKVKEAGITLSEYVMPGLGGRKWSEIHALETARVLNEIGNPDFIRLRTLRVRKGTPLFDRCEAGEFEQLTEDEIVDEIGLLIENLNCSSYVISDHVDNLLFEVEGQLPQDKEVILKVIARYKVMPPMEKLEFRLKKYLSSYRVYGSLNPQLIQTIQEAWESIQKESPDAEGKVEKAISALEESHGVKR